MLAVKARIMIEAECRDCLEKAEIFLRASFTPTTARCIGNICSQSDACFPCPSKAGFANDLVPAGNLRSEMLDCGALMFALRLLVGIRQIGGLQGVGEQT